MRTCLDVLGAERLGHGVRVVEDPWLLERVVEQQVGLEVCPASNVSLGVYETPAEVPLRTLLYAGARIALGADDPLLFGSRLAAQYSAARTVHGIPDAGLAQLARGSVLASRAPSDVRERLLAGVEAWVGSARSDVEDGAVA